MEASVIIGNLDSDSRFFKVNGVKEAIGEELKVSGIKPVELQTSEYTSLRDLIPASPSLLMSPMACNRLDSWKEIRIKDPLVKQAALSYLQPMTALQEVDTRSFLVKVKDNCLSGLFRCFGGINDAVGNSMRNPEDEEEVEGVLRLTYHRDGKNESEAPFF